MDLEPAVITNVLGALGITLYVKVVVGLCDYAVDRQWLPSDVTRKIIHITASCFCLWWPVFDASHWTWTLNVFTPSAYAVQLVVKGLILADPKDPDVRAMTRSGDPWELCEGPLLFCFVTIYCGLNYFRHAHAAYIIGPLGFGDGLAPLVGKRFPWLPYSTLGRGAKKTLAGSFTMFIGSILGIVLLQIGIGEPKELLPENVIGVALVATIAEGISGKWDNPAIALAIEAFLRMTSVSL